MARASYAAPLSIPYKVRPTRLPLQHVYSPGRSSHFVDRNFGISGIEPNSEPFLGAE